MGIKTVPQPPYSPDLAHCDFWLYPKLRGCGYETIEEMKDAVTKVIHTFTQKEFHVTFQNLLERYNKCCILTFDPGKYAIPKWCIGRKWHIPIASNRKKSCRRDLADEMGPGKKSHGTLIDWCTGREWPLNCMTVISAWWRSNMPFQRLRKPALSRKLSLWASGWGALENEKDTTLTAIRVGVNILQLYSVSNSVSQ